MKQLHTITDTTIEVSYTKDKKFGGYEFEYLVLNGVKIDDIKIVTKIINKLSHIDLINSKILKYSV